MSRIVTALASVLLTILAAGLVPGAANAAELVVGRATTIISDSMSNPNPRLFTDTVMDYRISVSNPVGNLTSSVKTVVIVENIPTNCDLQMTDLPGANNRGPVEFIDNNLLGVNLIRSGLAYTYDPASVDSIEFSTDGTNWVSSASATSGNYNPSIRAIRITLAGTFATSTTVQLRYRVKIR